jgi:hypothetical protein
MMSKREKEEQARLEALDRAMVADWLADWTPKPGHITGTDYCPDCECPAVLAQPQWGVDRQGTTYVWFVRECVRCGAGWTYDH